MHPDHEEIWHAMDRLVTILSAKAPSGKSTDVFTGRSLHHRLSQATLQSAVLGHPFDPIIDIVREFFNERECGNIFKVGVEVTHSISNRAGIEEQLLLTIRVGELLVGTVCYFAGSRPYEFPYVFGSFEYNDNSFKVIWKSDSYAFRLNTNGIDGFKQEMYSLTEGGIPQGLVKLAEIRQVAEHAFKAHGYVIGKRLYFPNRIDVTVNGSLNNIYINIENDGTLKVDGFSYPLGQIEQLCAKLELGD